MRAVALVLTLSSAVVACGPDLGTCDMTAATKEVYFNGTPFTEGQALVYQSCAGSFCHSESAVGKARSGAPHGLNFDVQPLTKGATPLQVTQLRAGIDKVRDEADELWGAIDSGFMPPPGIGERPDLTAYLDADAKMPVMLAGLDLQETRDKVRNWLACAAPIVAATTDSEQMGAVMGLGKIGTPGVAPITADFTSIYNNLLTTCVSCHGNGSPYKNQLLNVATKELAYSSLVSKPAYSGAGADMQCGGKTLVTPGNCMTSVLYVKLAYLDKAQGLCGEPMPLGRMAPLPTEVTKAVCDWITAGAKP